MTHASNLGRCLPGPDEGEGRAADPLHPEQLLLRPGSSSPTTTSTQGERVSLESVPLLGCPFQRGPPAVLSIAPGFGDRRSEHPVAAFRLRNQVIARLRARPDAAIGNSPVHNLAPAACTSMLGLRKPSRQWHICIGAMQYLYCVKKARTRTPMYCGVPSVGAASGERRLSNPVAGARLADPPHHQPPRATS